MCTTFLCACAHGVKSEISLGTGIQVESCPTGYLRELASSDDIHDAVNNHLSSQKARLDQTSCQLYLTRSTTDATLHNGLQWTENIFCTCAWTARLLRQTDAQRRCKTSGTRLAAITVLCRVAALCCRAGLAEHRSSGWLSMLEKTKFIIGAKYLQVVGVIFYDISHRVRDEINVTLFAGFRATHQLSPWKRITETVKRSGKKRKITWALVTCQHHVVQTKELKRSDFKSVSELKRQRIPYFISSLTSESSGPKKTNGSSLYPGSQRRFFLAGDLAKQQISAFVHQPQSPMIARIYYYSKSHAVCCRPLDSEILLINRQGSRCSDSAKANCRWQTAPNGK